MKEKQSILMYLFDCRRHLPEHAHPGGDHQGGDRTATRGAQLIQGDTSYNVFAALRIRNFYSGSRNLIFTHPGSRIPDQKTATKERGEQIFFFRTFICSHQFHKI